MRKAQKKQAEDFVELLSQAHDEVRRELEDCKRDNVLELLTQCQEGAIQLGNLIESTEKEGFVTIGMLEEYCEIVYQIYEEMIQGCVVDPADAGSALDKALARIRESIRDDIRVLREVVFLPYNSSMWDSLESVWKAADEDPDCRAYVIPIPYYDKNPDGSFRQMHYEGNQYPDYVPITDYKSFDFASHRPDMVFIHNPYDEWNHVTSVPPFFFAKNLKKYTDALVYIPYFILREIKPEDTEAVKEMQHFCLVPGVVYADRVIVQSEDMRQIYINVLSQAMGEGTRKQWQEKILGTGSPKFDKITGTRKEDLDLPEEWKKIIQKTDGTWKKIILYNTSVTALLKQENRMLAKMRDVFRIFQENRQEVALLWRPHPLIKATIESMRPKLWKDYEILVDEYRKQAWGIYDDTADMDRAIMISDAYYGDGSSLVQLCQKAGKPVMIQNVEYLSEQ